jgi:hypothetical protein
MFVQQILCWLSNNRNDEGLMAFFSTPLEQFVIHDTHTKKVKIKTQPYHKNISTKKTHTKQQTKNLYVRF